MEKTVSDKPTNTWLNVPIIALITRLLCRELTLQNEYLRQENKLLKSKIKKRIVFTEEERRTLVEAVIAMGRELMEQMQIVGYYFESFFYVSHQAHGKKWVTEWVSRHMVITCYVLLSDLHTTGKPCFLPINSI